jgi:nucleolar GTP-binding protein
MAVRNAACEALLAVRVEQKLKGSRINLIANRIHVAVPQKRDEVERKPFIPDSVLSKKKYNKEDPERMPLERDEEQALDGIDIYRMDIKSELPMCRKKEVKADKIL